MAAIAIVGLSQMHLAFAWAADRAEMIRRCKAATVLVDLHEEGTGSGFCVRADGVFLTNHHVVETTKIGGLVDVVLNPGERNQRVIKARVLKVDAVEDLALLKANGIDGLPALEIGNVKNLIETAPLIVFGYPLGKRLATTGQRYPSISVNTGKVSALRLSKGKLKAIQLDAAVNPGNSGGPVIDEQNKVIGVIVSGYDRRRINFAIPANTVKEFLAKPALIMATTRYAFADRHNPVRFDFELIQFGVTKQPDRIELTLISDSGSDRKYSAKRDKSGRYVTATPMPKSDKPVQVRLSGKIGHLHVTMDVDDQPFQIGSKQLSLSEIRRIEKRPTAHIVTTADGKKYAGLVKGLGKLTARSGAVFDPASVALLNIALPDSRPDNLDYEISAWTNNKRIAKAFGTLEVTGVPSHVSDDPYDSQDPFSPLVDSFVIEARIDGHVTLHINRHGLYWTHQAPWELGRDDNIGRFVLVNGKKWYLDWVQPAKGEKKSNKFPLKLGTANWEHKVLSTRPTTNARHASRSIQIHRPPSKTPFDNYALSINDTAPGAATSRILFRKKRRPPPPARISVSRKVNLRDGYWSFDEESGSRVLDVSGNGQHGTLTYPSRVPGRIGNAVRFNGFGALRCGDVGDFDHSDRFSIGAWFYPTRNRKGAIVSKTDTDFHARGYSILFDNHRICLHLISQWPKSALEMFAVTPIDLFKWHFVTVTYDGSGRADGVRFYVDGQESHCEITMDTLNAPTQTQAQFCIGGQYGQNAFDGLVDDVFVFNRTLAKEEVDRVYARGINSRVNTSQQPATKEGLVAHWTFDENEGPAVKDVSGNGNDTTLAARSHAKGKLGLALNLERAGFLNCGTIQNLDSDDEFSFGAWVNARTTDRRAILSRLDMNRDRGYEIILLKVSIYVQLLQSRKRRLLIVSRKLVTQNSWHHVFVTYDGSRKPDGLRLFIDGKLANFNAMNDNLTETIKSDAPLYIGSRRNGLFLFDGLLDDVRIYSTKLSDAQVVQLSKLSENLDANSSSNQSLTENLIAHWSFDNDENGLIRDSSGNGYNALFSLDTPIRGEGRRGNAISFKGNVSVDLGSDVGDFDADDSFSIGSWIQIGDTPKKSYIFSKNQSGAPNQGIGLILHENCELYCQLVNASRPRTPHRILVHTAPLLSSNKWHHILVTYDGSRTASGLHIYVDGQSAKLTVINDNLNSTTIRNRMPFRIGGHSNPEAAFVGKLDEFRIFTRVLTPAEIQRMANAD